MTFSSFPSSLQKEGRNKSLSHALSRIESFRQVPLLCFPELTFRGRGDSVLHRGLNRVFVVIGILHLLAAIAQVPQDAHAILDDLVADVGLLDRRAYHVEQRVHQALTLAQVLPRVLACARHVPQHAGRISEHGGPAGLAARRTRVPAAVRYYYVIHHHRHAVVDDGSLQVLKSRVELENRIISNGLSKL